MRVVSTFQITFFLVIEYCMWVVPFMCSQQAGVPSLTRQCGVFSYIVTFVERFIWYCTSPMGVIISLSFQLKVSDYSHLGACMSTYWLWTVLKLLSLLSALRGISTPGVVSVDPMSIGSARTALVVKKSLSLEELTVRCERMLLMRMTLSTALHVCGVLLTVWAESTMAFTGAWGV